MNLIDLIVAGLLLFFFLWGFRKGLIRTLAGPISLIIAAIIAYIYYSQSKNVIVSTLIVTIGALLINIVLNMVVKAIHSSKDDKESTVTWGRILGGLISMSWRGIIISFLLSIIIFFPVNIPKFQALQMMILESNSFYLLDMLSGNRLTVIRGDIKKALNVYKDPLASRIVRKSEEFKAFTEDEKIKNLLSDRKTLKAIESNNLEAILANPKIREVLNSPESMKKLMELNKKIMESKVE